MLTTEIRTRLEEVIGSIRNVSVPEEQGCTSLVRRIETAEGSYVLKSASHPKYREWVKKEAHIMRLLALEPEMPVPHFLTFVDDKEESHLLMSLEDGITLTTALRLAAGPIERRGLIRSFGRFLQNFHNRESAACLQQEGEWLDRQLKQARMYAESGQSDGTLDLLERLEADRPNPVTQALIHGDCNTDNVLVRDGEVYRFIDLAGMTIGDPRYDEALATRKFINKPDQLEAFYSGYRRYRVSEWEFRYFNDGLYEFF
jgi:aminoglycoside 3'-phosphotransferase-2